MKKLSIILLLAFLLALPAQAQEASFADCVWSRLGGFISANGWHQGPMTWQQVDVLLQMADMDNPATANYGGPGYADDTWDLLSGERVTTRTCDYTEVVYINTSGNWRAEAMLAVFWGRVLVVGFVDDGGHGTCGAFGLIGD